ncbi:hypothetical protein TRIUR3_32719 [Triticum urartu]|uniref:Uncharacterized protein n=1 Tax=Triticum urartu TaxID=4572 RepID=M7ZA01_TRIUA|nr:hypothetical protein TRIUR3_32719 [Triticum urartu]
MARVVASSPRRGFAPAPHPPPPSVRATEDVLRRLGLLSSNLRPPGGGVQGGVGVCVLYRLRWSAGWRMRCWPQCGRQTSLSQPRCSGQLACRVRQNQWHGWLVRLLRQVQLGDKSNTSQMRNGARSAAGPLKQQIVSSLTAAVPPKSEKV